MQNLVAQNLLEFSEINIETKLVTKIVYEEVEAPKLSVFIGEDKVYLFGTNTLGYV